VYDLVRERATHTLPQVLDCDLIFVSLPTPQREGELACDTSAVDRFFADHKGYQSNFVLRSTVPIGTTRRLRDEYSLPNLVHSPEFLTARCAFTDAQIPARNIIGYPNSNDFALNVKHPIAELYRTRFPSVKLFHMSSDESEAVKLGLNSFFAVKVAFFNELRTLADKLGLNWQSIMDGILSDGRIAHSHTKVPGVDGRAGFGGACLPKDLASLISIMEGNGLLASVTRGAHTRNIEDRKR
jgi:UDPglucose 6-dehydrogenase